MMGCPPKLFTYLILQSTFFIHLSLKFKLSWSHITLHKRLTFDRSFILAWKNWKTKRRLWCIIHLFVLYWVQQNCRYHHTIAVYVKSWLVWPLARCLKITEKVSFNIASEASYSYVYILSGQKLIKNAKNCQFWRVFDLKLAVKQCYQTS